MGRGTGPRLWNIGARRAACLAALLAAGCSNTPYPESEAEDRTVYYTSYEEAPKSLDPAICYTADDHELLQLCYEGLFHYGYLDRPLRLIPQLALAVPEPVSLPDAAGQTTGVLYRIDLQKGVHFADDPCFPHGRGREMVAADFEFAFKRAADPEVNCPVRESLSHIRGFRAFGESLRPLRAQWTAEGKDPARGHARAFHSAAGAIPGIRVTGDHALEIELEGPYPQILYWLAMGFISAYPHEAVDTYHEGRPRNAGQGPQRFAERPVGTGAYRFNWAETDRESRFVLDRNPNWWGLRHPERKAPSTVFPLQPGEPEDAEAGVWTPEDAGRPLAQIDRVVFSLEIEQLSRFGKFMQGYYDRSRVPREMFTQVMQPGGGLSPEMKDRGITLHRGVDADLRYVGFNMEDDQIGAPARFHDPALESRREERLARNRALRQAMSLAVDATEYRRIFFNGLGSNAQSPIPPGIPGHDPGYRNPFRQYDPSLARARELLVRAGLANGVDPSTGRPLRLTFDIGLTDTRYVVMCQFLVECWRKLGLDVRLEATDYNKFQEKIYKGTFQIFEWGWMLDYPDPENFLFLLHGPNSGKYNEHSPNHARFENAEYDRWFKRMETLRNGERAAWQETAADGSVRSVEMTREQIIAEALRVLERECPWIPLVYREVPILAHGWLGNVKPHPMTYPFAKYCRIDKARRDAARKEWNRPIRWPLAALALIAFTTLIPAWRVIRKEAG